MRTQMHTEDHNAMEVIIHKILTFSDQISKSFEFHSKLICQYVLNWRKYNITGSVVWLIPKVKGQIQISLLSQR